MTRFIAEVCSNHNGDPNRAFRLIDAAHQAGCDGVKFQLFQIDKLFAAEILSHPEYAEKLRLRRHWEMPVSWIRAMKAACHTKGLLFGCTPFHLEAVDALAPHVDFFKIASYEFLWDDLRNHILNTTDKPVTISTGMATGKEIRGVLQRAGNNWQHTKRIEVLHCVSEYPAKVENVHLSCINRIRADVKWVRHVGYSDHSVNPGVLYRAAFKYQASTIEFHLDLDDKYGWEYGQGHCWTASEIKPVIRGIRDGKIADGDPLFNMTDSPDRDFMADPGDGLRPLLAKRKELTAE